ncbi:MAG TPA: S8 family serine peptidase [Casimicrobiaceae bacterium]|nr:S8 family serine peptidase [Casimicrobiaceae bacterium]
MRLTKSVAALLASLLGIAPAVEAGPLTATPLTPDSTYSRPKSTSGALAQTDPALLGRTDSTPVNVLLKYDYDPTASYAGNVKGLAATNPSVTGKKLKDNKPAVSAYEQYAAAVSNKISAAVKSAVPNAKIGQAFTTAYGGVKAQIPANRVATLLGIPGVAAVQQDSLEQPSAAPLTGAEPIFTGAANVWPSLGGEDQAASGVVIGVIDTGIWPEHPLFANNGLPPPPGGPYGCQFGDGSDVAHLGPTFACNRKLVGAYAFTQTYMAVIGSDGQEFCNDTTGICSPRDPEGHGTHTSSIAAGDRVNSAPLYGVDRGPISGMAPGARVIMYRVCLSQGCFNSDSVAAVQQAILDDVDVINFSISGGRNPYTDPVELAFLDAFHAGISVNASAGNSGPGPGTTDHGGPWVTTVGASTSNRFFTTTLHLTADGGATFDMPGVTITNGIGSTPVALAQSLPGEDALCQTELAPSTATGKVVLCQRGTNARVDKGFNVAAGGAAGMVLYNPINMDVETDNHWLPAVHVNGPSDALLAFVNSHTNVKASWAQGTPSVTQGDVMAAFSSRGPQDDFIKPDITAPGIQVLEGMTPQPDQTTPTNGPSGLFFQAIAGTSMSGPHAAGISALIKAAHPTWTPAMIKSALMTSAVQDVVKEDGATPFDPFDAGSGSIRADLAVNPTLVFDESYDDFFASMNDPLHRIDLNIASVNAPTMTGQITTKRTAINVSGKDQTLTVSTVAPDGATIFVSDKDPSNKGPSTDNKISLSKKGTTDIWITISAPDLPDGQYFGRITLDPKKAGFNPVTIPVAFFKQQGVVTLVHTCAPTTFSAKGGVSHCAATVTNLASVAANVDLTVTGQNTNALNFTNISAPASAIKNNNGVEWSGALTPALAPTIASITDITGGGPAGGYLPLSLFPSITPIAGVGDDTITNFNVPTFYFGGEAYSRIGVVSNGYVVIGGGDATDIVYVPQTFPNPARPNNVIALFWNDMNPPAGGAMRIGVLGDGSNNWLVIDYEQVKNFSDTNTHTGEIWLQLSGGAAGTGPSSEQITLSYGTANSGAGDPGSGINWGAENRDGTSGLNIPGPGPANGSEFRVTTAPPTPGGSQTITFDASSKKAGTYKSVAGMTSDVTPGVTEVTQTLTVTK